MQSINKLFMPNNELAEKYQIDGKLVLSKLFRSVLMQGRNHERGKLKRGVLDGCGEHLKMGDRYTKSTLMRQFLEMGVWVLEASSEMNWVRC